MPEAGPTEWRVEARKLAAEIGVMRARLRDLAQRLAETSAYKGMTIDQMTPETWRTMTAEERVDWTNYWRLKGQVSFCCLKCGFPTAQGTVGCEACMPRSPG